MSWILPSAGFEPGTLWSLILLGQQDACLDQTVMIIKFYHKDAKQLRPVELANSACQRWHFHLYPSLSVDHWSTSSPDVHQGKQSLQYHLDIHVSGKNVNFLYYGTTGFCLWPLLHLSSLSFWNRLFHLWISLLPFFANMGFNPLQSIYWKSPISIFRYVRLWDLYIPREKWLNYLQTVETLIRCRILRHLIWVCTVCQLPF